MNWDQWLELVQTGGGALYLLCAYLAVPALMLIEVVLLLLRRRQILGHLGWRRDQLRRS